MIFFSASVCSELSLFLKYMQMTVHIDVPAGLDSWVNGSASSAHFLHTVFLSNNESWCSRHTPEGGVVTSLHPLCLAGLEAPWVGLCICLMGRRGSLWRDSRVLKALCERRGRLQRQEGLGGGMKDEQGSPWFQAGAGLTAQQDCMDISSG